MKYALIVVIVALTGSFIWNGGTSPKLSDREYLVQYRVLNSTNKTDAEILEQRAESETESKKWKHSNALLDKAFKENNISLKYLQKSVYQVQFYEEYYDKNVTADEFIKMIR